MTFYLGTHMPAWLVRSPANLFVSVRRLRARGCPGRAASDWALDSGGFTELAMHGRWTTPPRRYADEVRRYAERVGRLRWAAIQDWMCEPVMLARTGRSIPDHQRSSIESLLDLRRLAPELQWTPVVQGWHVEDYLAHAEGYAAAGVDLAREPVVGVGSVCRRQGTAEAVSIFRELHRLGLKLHGFGLKTLGLLKCLRYLASADSLAWSFRARQQRRPMLPTCEHATCVNCYDYAHCWRDELLGSLPASRGMTP